MTRVRKSIALSLALAVGTAVLAPLPAMAQAGCDWYVKKSLEQQSQNLAAKSCQKTGPQWSSDPNVHMKFCSSVRPVIWKKVAQMRKTVLDNCKK